MGSAWSQESRGKVSLCWGAIYKCVVPGIIYKTKVRPEAGRRIIDDAAIACIETGELRVIKVVKCFRTKLGSHILMEREVLEDTHIKV